MSKKRKLRLFRGDKALWIIVAALFLGSLLVVYSATAAMAYREVDGNTSYYLFRQARFILGGFFMIILVHWIDYKYYARYAKALFKLSVVLVILAYVIGVSFNDASRWIRIPGMRLTFQPSELLKVTLMIVLAQQLAIRQKYISKIPILPAFSVRKWRQNPQRNLNIWLYTTQPLILPVVVATLIVLPSNLSTAAILFLTCVIVMIVGRVRGREITRLMLAGMIGIVLIVGTMKIAGVGRAETWVNRVTQFVQIDDDDAPAGSQDNFQAEQAQIAIASGGFMGKGPGNSTQRSQLPHPYSDFAYAFIIEEYGMVGGIVVFILYLWIFYRCGLIVRRCNRPSQGLMVLGLSLVITMQAFVNMGVSVGIIPVTGQPLPLISLGGSSVFFTCIAIGMILGVSRETERDLLMAQKEAVRVAELEAGEAEETAPAPVRQPMAPPAAQSVSPKPRVRKPISPIAPEEDELTIIDRSHEVDPTGRNYTPGREVVDLWEEEDE